VINVEEWPTVRFGDVIKKVNETCDPLSSGLDRYVSGSHIETDITIIRKWGDINDGYLGPAFNKKFQPGQVLYVSRRTYLRKIAVANFEGICSNTTFVLDTINHEVLLRQFIPVIMNSKAFQEFSELNSKGSVTPYINFSDLAKFKFRLPSIECQKRIMNIFWEIIDNENQCENLLQSLESQMYCQREKFLAQFEEKNGLVALGTISNSITKGQSPRWQGFEYTNEGSLFLTSENIGIGELDISEPKYISRNFLDKLNRGKTEPGNLLITIVGTIGRAALSPDYCDAGTNQAVSVIKPKKEYSPEYLLEVILGKKTQRYFRKSSVITAQPNISLKDINNIMVPVVSKIESKNLILVISKIRNEIRNFSSRLSNLRSLRHIIANSFEVLP